MRRSFDENDAPDEVDGSSLRLWRIRRETITFGFLDEDTTLEGIDTFDGFAVLRV
jgi:hypothetical protein